MPRFIKKIFRTNNSISFPFVSVFVFFAPFLCLCADVGFVSLSFESFTSGFSLLFCNLLLRVFLTLEFGADFNFNDSVEKLLFVSGFKGQCFKALYGYYLLIAAF